MAFSIFKATLLLGFIAVVVGKPSIRANQECSECKDGVPVGPPVDVIVTPPPADDCAEGIVYVPAPLPPITPAPPPPC
ncbi:hypothetical protein Bhyg_05948 [Pseudolycoriella hygida]|uniref:Uncharacterized protein n=1 Tax=Pseudolycoriella hygida TaxID=35572 RepID=A0A9Q0MZW3_9DIPT|nr:hypothetical protein Bhyg_05948 [Pseudolycoriella hygida]